MRSTLIVTFAACAVEAEGPPTPDASPEPVADQASYTAACEAILGRVPPLSCAEAEEIPVTVTDDAGTRRVTQVADLEDGYRCDAPSGLSACIPGSRAARGVTDRGVPWVFVCRRYAEGGEGYDQIGLIASDPATGATCFWSTPEDGLRRDDPVPRPGSPEDVGWSFRSFWYTLDELATHPCVECHDNDAWVHDPWIEPVGVPSAPLGAYTFVAAQVLGWTRPPVLVHPDAAPCTSCHRLSTGRSCELAQDAAGRKGWRVPVSTSRTRWPWSRWMDDFDATVLAERYGTEAAWEGRYGAAIAAITACCAAPDDPACWAAP